MNVPSVNLLPRSAIEARERRVWLRRWVFIDAVAVVAVVVGGVGSYVSGLSRGQEVEDRLRGVTAEIGSIEQTLPARRAALAGVQKRLEASEAVRLRPDWGALLAYIDALRGTDVVLDLVVIENRAGDGVALRVRGLSAEQGLESGLILGLERSGLFNSTRLIKSERVAGPGGQRIAFEIVSEFAAESSVVEAPTP